MTCGNKRCEWYDNTKEDNCKASHCYTSKDKIQGMQDHVFFLPDFCSLFISKEQYEVV